MIAFYSDDSKIYALDCFPFMAGEGLGKHPRMRAGAFCGGSGTRLGRPKSGQREPQGAPWARYWNVVRTSAYRPVSGKKGSRFDPNRSSSPVATPYLSGPCARARTGEGER